MTDPENNINPLKGHASEGEPVTPEQLNLWNTVPPVSPTEKMPKKRTEWGLLEVCATVLITLCSVVGVTLVIMFIFMMNIQREGITEVDEVTSRISELETSPLVIVVSSLAMYLGFAIGMSIATYLRGAKSFAKDFKLKFKLKDLWIGLLLAAGGFAFMQGTGFLLEQLGVDVNGASNVDPYTNQTLIWQIILLFGLVTFVGPFFEELFFRGMLLTGIQKTLKGKTPEDLPATEFGETILAHSAQTYFGFARFRGWLAKHASLFAAIVSSAIFGLMHYGGSWVTVAMTGALGLVFALAFLKTKRLGTPIFAHIFYNGTVAVITFMSIM